MDSLAFWREIDRQLSQNEAVFIALVVANSHGSPGTVGARLLLDSRGQAHGTIGGGIMEANVLAKGRDALSNGRLRPQIERFVHRKNGGTEASGLICAGEQSDLFAVLEPGRDHAPVQRFVQALEQPAGVDPATLVIDRSGLRVDTGVPDTGRPQYRLTDRSDNWQYAEDSVSRRRLAIVGGGHCGAALAGLAADVGYSVDVFDTRAAVVAASDWPDTACCHVVLSYADLAASGLYPGSTTVVVMTTAVTCDIAALAALESLDWLWIGVMGSQSKIRVIQQSLRERGVAPEYRDTIHGPIGLPMKSDTPQEIAVSIMGQLLANTPAQSDQDAGRS